MKRLFSFYLDEDLKSQAQIKATDENRSIASLIEVALRFYLDRESLGSRVTVESKKNPRGSRTLADILVPDVSTHTARVIDVDPDNALITLDAPDPETGRREFSYKEIVKFHLM